MISSKENITAISTRSPPRLGRGRNNAAALVRDEATRRNCSRAFSGEVDTGSPKKTRQLEKLERCPIPCNRAAL
jgi:hypothetical protein